MVIVFIVRTVQGGMLSHIKTLAKGLKDNGHNLYVIGDIDDDTKKLFETQGIKVYNIVFNNESNVLALFKCALKVKKLLNAIKPDIIHMHGYIAAVVGRLACITRYKNTVVTVHNYMPEGRASKVLKMMEQIFMKKTKKYIAVSNALKHYMTNVIGIKSEKIVTVYNGIEDKVISNADSFKKTDEGTIVSMIRLIPAKGVEYLIKAMVNVNKVIKDVKLLILGDGPYREYYEKLIKDLKLDNVFLLGYKNDAVEILEKANLLVLPSLSEGLPVSCIEAMRAKKPIVATMVGGIPEEVINGENGILVKAGDTDALANAIIKIMKDKKLAEVYGENGYKRFKELFSSNVMIENTYKLYKEILAKEKR